MLTFKIGWMTHFQRTEDKVVDAKLGQSLFLRDLQLVFFLRGVLDKSTVSSQRERSRGKRGRQERLTVSNAKARRRISQ